MPPTSLFLNIHLNIIFPSMPGSFKWSLSRRSPYQNFLWTSPLTPACCMLCPSHLKFLTTYRILHVRIYIIVVQRSRRITKFIAKYIVLSQLPYMDLNLFHLTAFVSSHSYVRLQNIPYRIYSTKCETERFFFVWVLFSFMCRCDSTTISSNWTPTLCQCQMLTAKLNNHWKFTLNSVESCHRLSFIKQNKTVVSGPTKNVCP